MARGRGRGGGRGKGKANGADAKVRDAERGLGDNSGVDHDATAEANVANRRDAMRSALARVYEIDCEIEAVIAAHVAELREDRSAVIKDLRERYGLTAKIFRARYYPYKLERAAEEANDEITEDALRELFEVCPVTGQGSFAAALDTVTPAKPKDQAAIREAARGAEPETTETEAAGEPEPFAEDARETTDPEAAWELGTEARKHAPSMAEALKRCPFDQPHQAVLRSRFEEGVEAADMDIRRQRGETVQQPTA